MGSSSGHFKTPEPEETGIEEETLSNSQEAVPMPFLAGQRKVALRWLSRVYKQTARPAPAARSGKK